MAGGALRAVGLIAVIVITTWLTGELPSQSSFILTELDDRPTESLAPSVIVLLPLGLVVSRTGEIVSSLR